MSYPVEMATTKREMVYGMQEAAEYLGVLRSTFYQWAFRGKLPPADLIVSGKNAWYQSTLDKWWKIEQEGKT